LVRTAWRGLAAALVVVSAVGVAGCGSSSKDSSGGSSSASSKSTTPTPSASPSSASDSQASALDAYVAAGQSKMPGLIKAFKGIFSAVDIEAVHPGTVRYRYVYAKQMDASLVVPALRKQGATLQSSCDNTIFPGMTQAGITDGQGVEFVYLNSDKSKLWSYTCKPS
jgi:hypothetical protein